MIRQIKYFQAVVRNNSFSEAAEECHISQSAISQHPISILHSRVNMTRLAMIHRELHRFRPVC